jgi:hypothetical protein
MFWRSAGFIEFHHFRQRELRRMSGNRVSMPRDLVEVPATGTFRITLVGANKTLAEQAFLKLLAAWFFAS